METKTTDSVIQDINNVCDAIGYRLGYEAYVCINPVIQAIGSFKLTLLEGFRRGWIEARDEDELVITGELNVPDDSGK